MSFPTLSKLIKNLETQGCYPGIYRRGSLYRAHVNISGNFWPDENTPFKALRTAIKAWEKAGKPMDGVATDECLCPHSYKSMKTCEDYKKPFPDSAQEGEGMCRHADHGGGLVHCEVKYKK